MQRAEAEPELDVLVRGAGPVGCALAITLQGCGLRVALLGDANSVPPLRPTFRPIALSYASRLILERIGAWADVAATPIETVEVSQQGGFGRTRMSAADAGVPALGYVTQYAVLLDELRTRARALFVEREASARCIVHAEGAAQGAEKRYAQDALVARVRTEPASRGTAFERFTPEGPLALLPLESGYAVVWSCKPSTAQALLELAPQEFLQALARAAGARAGRPVHVESRALHPLVLRVRTARVAGREVYIGNAAQTLHPVAGQGLNLGLRDAWDLACLMRDAPDPGAPQLLARYAAARRWDAGATTRVTDLLAHAFLGRQPLARAARGVALTALDLLPGPRRFFARRMIYGPSALP